MECLYIVGGNVKWCSFFEKQCQFLKKLNVQLSHDSVLSFLGINLEEVKTGVQTKNQSMNVNCSIIYDIQNVEISPYVQQWGCGDDEWIKKCSISTQGTIQLFSHKKE